MGDLEYIAFQATPTGRKQISLSLLLLSLLGWFEKSLEPGLEDEKGSNSFATFISVFVQVV
jgi:hypothetical protein